MAASCSAKVGDSLAHQENWPAQVHLPDQVDVARLNGLDGAGDEDGGVVDHDVEPPERVHGAGDAARDALGFAHVHHDALGLAAFIADGLGDRMDGAREAFVLHGLGAGADGDGASGAAEFAGDVFADAP